MEINPEDVLKDDVRPYPVSSLFRAAGIQEPIRNTEPVGDRYIVRFFLDGFSFGDRRKVRNALDDLSKESVERKN